MAGQVLIRDNLTGVVTTSGGTVVGVLPDASGEPDGEWLSTSGGAAVWVPAAADLVPIADAGGYFTATDVEGALQELGAASGGGGVFTRGATSAVFAGSATSGTVTVTHSLGATPTAVVMQADDSGPAFAVCVVKNLGATTFDFFMRDPTSVPRTGTQVGYWVAFL